MMSKLPHAARWLLRLHDLDHLAVDIPFELRPVDGPRDDRRPQSPTRAARRGGGMAGKTVTEGVCVVGVGIRIRQPVTQEHHSSMETRRDSGGRRTRGAGKCRLVGWWGVSVRAHAVAPCVRVGGAMAMNDCVAVPGG